MSTDAQSIIDEYYRKKQPLISQIQGLFQNTEVRFKAHEQAKMPHLPQEEETSGNLTDQVAKESSDSTASTHRMHSEAHKANLGPVKADNLPEPESKEALKKRTEELNKST